jgi:predicted dinucleotide-binding enzyme
MKIGIIGTSPRAERIERALREAGHELVVGSPYDQVRTSEVIVIAVPWDKVDKTVVQMGQLGDTVIVDAVDATEAPADDLSGAEQLARKLNSPHVVEAFGDDAKPGDAIPVCADDPQAKAVVMELIRSCGYEPTDAGPLAKAGPFEKADAA